MNNRGLDVKSEPAITPSGVGMGRLFWTIADAVIVGDVETGLIVLWNPAAEAMFGYTAAEAQGEPIEMIVAPLLRAHHRTGIERYRTTRQGAIIGSPSAVTVAAVRKDGKELAVELTLSPIEDQKASDLYVLAIIRDVTERVEAEARLRTLNAELELARQKEQFLAMVAHELRTPLTVIRGHMQLMQRHLTRTGDTALERASTIMRKVKELETLVSDLLDVSRMESGHMETRLSKLEYSLLVLELAQEMRLLHPEGKLDVNVPGDVWVQGDEARLRQVLVNLLDNAFKYGPPRTAVRIIVEAADDWITTYVSDDGPPLPKEERSRVFDRFYRLSTSVALAGGLGIGLYICRGVVEAHGGRIWIAEDDHSSFAFSLPSVSINQGHSPEL